MPMVQDYHPPSEDVGQILIKVQADLLNLKGKLEEQQLEDGDAHPPIDMTMLQSAIMKTEEGIKLRTEQVFEKMNNRVLTLPCLDTLPRRLDDVAALPSVSGQENWDTLGGQNVDPTVLTGIGETSNFMKPRHSTATIPMQMRRAVLLDRRAQLAGPTPGQQVKIAQEKRMIMDPLQAKNREVLEENFGIQLPLINQRVAAKPPAAIIKGPTMDTLTVLPKANRHDPQLQPPAIHQEDAQKGVLSLVQRGLVPATAKITFDPPPVSLKSAPLHDAQDKTKTTTLAVPSDAGIYLSPLSPEKKEASVSISVTPAVPKTTSPMKIMSVQPFPPPTTPASALESHNKSHRFAIQHGKVRDMSHEFQTFKQHYCLSWGSIVTMLKHMQKMLVMYSVPLAFINGDVLADLALEFEMEKAPSKQDLLGAIVNREDVENIINRPGRRFMAADGRDAAATLIQACFRRYHDRLHYLEYRQRKWAAGVIAISWIMYVKMTTVRKQLKTRREEQLVAFRERSKVLAKNWDTLIKSKRVIIHVPSLGYSEQIRSRIPHIEIAQNTQMARLCDLKDPNVDVIYVSPVPINDEIAQYYSKLLGLKPAIESGNVADQKDFSDHYRILTPEAIKSFPAHNMCLMTLLKYSPRTLKRIKNLIRGRDAILVTRVPHRDDLYISDLLDVPLLCSDPDTAYLYSSKSGGKRVFASAGVSMPPGEYDVYSMAQLVECLAQLVTDNLDISRWLFKLDDEFDGRGIAYCDVISNLKCHEWALKEAQRYGEKWSKKWAQEAAYVKILSELPEILKTHGTPTSLSAYTTWDIFLKAFLSQGGVVEAAPPSDSVTALTVDMFIAPTGKISIECLGDQVHAQSLFHAWGLSVPQSSVEPSLLNRDSLRIAEQCRARGVIGFMAIDFITFIHPRTMQQELWAIDLKLSYTDSAAAMQLMNYVSGGELNAETHFYHVPLPHALEDKRSQRRRRKKADTEVQERSSKRYMVMSSKLYHSNLSIIHYSVFFQMCRAHGIGYDIKDKQGTVFTLVDSYKRSDIGMLSIGESLQAVLSVFATNMSMIHNEISSPNMQGDSNFRAAINDIEEILGTTIDNAEDQEKSEETQLSNTDSSHTDTVNTAAS